MKMMALPASFACLNNVLTFAAHIQTNISMNSDQDAEKKATQASQATALARSVFQDHGAQYKSTHFGGLAQIF
jgi:hypothetical protein